MARKIKGRNYQQSAGQGFKRLTNKRMAGQRTTKKTAKTGQLHYTEVCGNFAKFCENMNSHQRQLQD